MLPRDDAQGSDTDSYDRPAECRLDSLLLHYVRAVAHDITARVHRVAHRPAPGATEYRVCVFAPGTPDQRSFTGPRAVVEAADWYERVAAGPGVTQLWLIRRDGAAWQLVDGWVRGPGGGWEPVRVPGAAARPTDDTATDHPALTSDTPPDIAPRTDGPE